MEVEQRQGPKKLHHHALPVVIVAIAVLATSVPVALKQHAGSTGSGEALAHDLFSQPLLITPADNGIAARISLNNEQQPHLSPEVSQAGRTAELMFSLDRQ
jgi:hypothetical protein